ncbi:hypothetical protein Gotur_024877, partial [Gossypium turneri]
MTQMQATTAEVQRKYEELQLQLKADTAAREAELQREKQRFKRNMKNSSYDL